MIVELEYGREFEIAPGIVVKPIRLKSNGEARIGIDAPREIRIAKAESLDPDVLAFRQALAAVAGGER